MTTNKDMATWWHETYIAAARRAYPDVTAGHRLAVGWKITRVDGTTSNAYYWPLVNGDHDLPVLHEAPDWQADNSLACPSVPGDGLCLVHHSGFAAVTSGGLSIQESTGHVLVYPTDLAKGSIPEKLRVPWVVDVDCFSPLGLVRDGFVSNLRKADLRGADLRGADLRGADLRGADLRDADLRGANLRGADLLGADLRGADLRGADLRDTNLRGADLRDGQAADLRFADLRGAIR